MSYENVFNIKRMLRPQLIKKIVEHINKNLMLNKIEFGEIKQRTTNLYHSEGRCREGQMDYTVYFTNWGNEYAQPGTIRFTIATKNSRVVEIFYIYHTRGEKYIIK